MTPNERRLAEGLFWVTSEPPRLTLWQRYAAQAPVIVFWLGLAMLSAGFWGVTHYQKISAELAAQKQTTHKFIGLLADAMNGNPIYDKTNDTAVFFDKPTFVKLRIK